MGSFHDYERATHAAWIAWQAAEAGITAGTHHLLRYLIGRDCRKFVLASSIVVVGLPSVAFRSLHLPMPELRQID